MNLELINGDGLAVLRNTHTGLVLTDAPIKLIGDALRLCQTNELPFINCYGWLHPGKYPGEKHVWPYVRIIQAFDVGKIIDPFMGSGSIGIAAVLCGLDFVGVERDPERFAYAKTRIENTAPGPDPEYLRDLP